MQGKRHERPAAGIDPLWPPLADSHRIRPMAAPPSDRLESWKQIAAYLNRGVRTVRRWETEEGLPVHRHMHHSLGRVYAYRTEIDAWRESGPPSRAPRVAGARSAAAPDASAAISIAVLPFINLGPAPDDEYFADGLTDEVITTLCSLRDLRITSRTSSMAFKGTALDVRTIARSLGVRYILEGAVRRAGDRLRITARLIEADADRHLWADQHDGPLEDVFAIQEKLARMVVDALRLHLTPGEDQRLSNRPIPDVHAYECYLQARQEALRWRKDAIDHAIRLLENGLAIVGENAQLRAALGGSYLQYREAGIDFSEWPLHAAEACMQQVFALDPDSIAGLRLRAWLHYSHGRIQQAVRDLKAVLEVEPGDPDTLGLLCNCYLISGQLSVARPIIDRLLEIDPLTPLSRCLPGWAEALQGNFAAAVEPYRQMFAMDTGNPVARLFYVWVLVANGRADDAARIVADIPPGTCEGVADRLACFLAHAAAGRRREALACLNEEVEAAAGATDHFPRFLAQGHALAGEPGQAMRWLRAAVARGFINYPFLVRHDPLLDSLRGRSDFQALMEQVRGRWQAFIP